MEKGRIKAEKRKKREKCDGGIRVGDGVMRDKVVERRWKG